LRKELLAAETDARAKKRKAAGLPVENEQPVVAAIEDEEANKRRKLLQEALELDKDSDSDEDENENEDGPANGGNATCVALFTVSPFGNLCSSVVLKTAQTKMGQTKVAVVVVAVAMVILPTMMKMRTTRMMKTMKMTTPQSCFGSSRR
jgi:hypothetical protein